MIRLASPDACSEPPATRHLARSVVRIALFPVALVTVPFWLVPSALLALIAETGAGRACGIAGVLGWLALPALLGERSPLRRAAAAAAAALALVGVVGWTSPVEQVPAATGPGSRFRGANHRRWTPASLVPEVDQFKLGSYVIPFLDPLIDRAQAARVRAAFVDVYGEMGRDPEFARLTSVMSFAYGDLFLRQEQPEHTFEYVPAGHAGRRPVLLFLHGSFGSFQAYLFVLKELADRTGCAIVAPAHGFGNWANPDRPGRIGGLTRIRLALAAIAADPRLDATQVSLAGLSNGGLGVTRAGLALPQAFRQLIYISPVIEPELVGEPAFTAAWRGRPVRIQHGALDNRIDLPVVEEAARRARAGGIPVDLRVFADQEHWLFFTRRHEIVGQLESWMREVRPPGS